MYLDLEQLRFEDTLKYSLKVSEKLKPEGIFIPTMLVQPYIENSLKHGLFHVKGLRILEIVFSPADGNNIQCVIEDNGVGREKAKEFQKQRSKLYKSFATQATQDRLDLLNYGKNKKIGVVVIDLFDKDKEASGTKVILTIPNTNA
jgi:LytS/YehU family sensor histidine kinase